MGNLQQQCEIHKEYIDKYYADDASKLHKMVNKILRKFGGITDRQEFYSLANEVFLEVINNYDGVRSFDGFLYSCLSRRIKSKMSAINRPKRKRTMIVEENGEKRKVYLNDLSFDAPIEGADGTHYLKDIVPSEYILEEDIFGGQPDEKIERYLSQLSLLQRKIVVALMNGERAGKISKRFGLTEREYADQMRGIRSIRNIKFLF